MTEGTDGTTDGRTDDELPVATEVEAVEGVGTYETGEGVVFYDTENPLAWVQSGNAVDIEEMA